MGDEKFMLLPQDIDAEIQVLGAIILNGISLIRIKDFISPEDFYRQRHRIIYDTALSLYNENVFIDLTTLSDKLRQDEKLIEIGGATYLSTLVNACPTEHNIVTHARILKDKAIKRKIINLCTEASDVAYNDSCRGESIAKELIEAAYQQGIVQSNGYIKWFSLFEEREKKRKKRAIEGEKDVILTFIRDKDRNLDDLMNGGLHKGTLTCVVADTKKGKTFFGVHMSYVTLMQQKNVLLIHHEGTTEQVASRLDSRFFNIKYENLVNYDKTQEEEERTVRKFELFKERKEENVIMKYYPPGTCNANEIRQLCKYLKDIEGWVPDLIVDDYSDYMIPNAKWSDDNKHRLDSIYSDLSALSVDLYGEGGDNKTEVAVLTFSQTKAEFFDKELKKNSAGGSIGKIQRVDVMIGLYDKEEDRIQDISILRLKILANRSGETGPEIVLYPDFSRGIINRTIEGLND